MTTNLSARWAFRSLFALLLLGASFSCLAQEKPKSKDKKPVATATPVAAPAASPDMDKSFQAATAGLKFREIGPATMGGRIDDIEAVPGDPRTIYVATAAGGILKTTNGGTSWTVIFDKESVPSIGDGSPCSGTPPKVR